MTYRLAIFILFLFPAFVFSQEIKSNDVDPFTNERTIETSLVSLKQGLSGGFGISYTAINNRYFLNLIGYGSVDNSVSPDDKIWLVLEDGNVIQFNDRAEVEAEGVENKNIFIYHYFAKMDDIEILKSRKVSLVRFSSPDGKLTDTKISKKESKTVMKLNEIFFVEINKADS